MKTTIKSKTRKSISKRFKVTKNGKVLRRAVGQDHLLSKQTGHKRRRLRKMVEMSEAEAKKVKKLLAK
jgi:ribosomal protein L35